MPKETKLRVFSRHFQAKKKEHPNFPHKLFGRILQLLIFRLARVPLFILKYLSTIITCIIELLFILPYIFVQELCRILVVNNNSKNDNNPENDLHEAILECPTTNDHQDFSVSRLIIFLNAAKVSLKICVIDIERGTQTTRLLNELICRQLEGVSVRVYTTAAIEKTMPGQESIKQLLEKYGIAVRYFTFQFYSTTEYHQFIILDDSYMLTGLKYWNDTMFTRKRNDVAFLTNDPPLVQKFCTQFDKLWEFGENDNNC